MLPKGSRHLVTRFLSGVPAGTESSPCGSRDFNAGTVITEFGQVKETQRPAAMGAVVTTGPKKEEERYSWRPEGWSMKEGLPRESSGHGATARARAGPTGQNFPGSPPRGRSRIGQPRQNPEGEGTPGAAVLRISLGVHRAGPRTEEGRGRGRITNTPEMPQTWGKCVLKHCVDRSLLLSLNLCLSYHWRKSSSRERIFW